MTVRELQTILADYHPEEEVGAVSMTSNRNMTFLGINDKATTELGHLVLNVDFTRNNHPVETPMDKLKRQEEEIKKAMDRLTREQQKEVKTKGHRRKNRTDAQKLVDGFIPTGGAGRPRKVVTEDELLARLESKARGRGRPRKESQNEAD